jgi:hypothetical protein
MSAFTRLYYANRSLDGHASDDSLHLPAEKAVHPTSPSEDPYGDLESLLSRARHLPDGPIGRPDVAQWQPDAGVRPRAPV